MVAATVTLDGQMTADDREALRVLLMERGFVEASDGRSVRDRVGASLPWMYDGAEVNLSFRGVTLMASAVLDRLATFSSTQLATYGQSAIPILTTCLSLTAGRYTGLAVRKEPKLHGAGRRIDGPLDRSRSAVVIDESLASGMSAREAIAALEGEGIEVEGIVCVVEFSGYGAAEWLTSLGYRVETVFDVWRDLGRIATRRPERSAPVPWSEETLPAGLAAGEVARAVIEAFPRTGRVPRPPTHLAGDHDARGGTFVSIRRRSDDVRLARAGALHADAEAADTARDVVLAACEAVRSAPAGALDDPGAVKVAVSFLGRREAIFPGAIDPERHALLVRGLGPLDRLGAALPNAPHYDDEIQQYCYARTVAARFSGHEPHELFRQTVERVVEPGVTWPSYGAPPTGRDWTRDPAWSCIVGARAWHLVATAVGVPVATGTEPLPEPEEPVFAVGVSLYADGLIGCALDWGGRLDAGLRAATTRALGDARVRPVSVDRLTIVVSLLLRRRRLGRVSPDRLPLFYRLGRDTLQAAGRGGSGVVLAHFAVEQSCGAHDYQRQVLAKAGIGADCAEWTAYDTAGWIARAGAVERLDRGVPARAASCHDRWAELAAEIAGFVVAQRLADGLPAYVFRPWDGTQQAGGTATRVLLAITGMLEASWAVGAAEHASAMVEAMVVGDEVRVPRPGLYWDSGSDAQLLSCLALLARDEHRALARRLVGRLRPLIRDDGTIRAGRVRITADLDFLSGSVLCALARAAPWLYPDDVFAGIDLASILAFSRRRFALAHPWGMVWWHGQAWSALADRVTGAGRFAFTIADWALDRQSDISGAFVIDHLEPARTSFLTACVLEGIADVWALATRRGDARRARRYAEAWRRGMRFVDRLTMREGDAFFSPRPAMVRGGVRETLIGTELRIDVAGHALLALGKGLAAAGRAA